MFFFLDLKGIESIKAGTNAQGPGTKFLDQSLQASKWYLKCKYQPENWITCSLWGLLKSVYKYFYDLIFFYLQAQIPDHILHLRPGPGFALLTMSSILKKN